MHYIFWRLLCAALLLATIPARGALAQGGITIDDRGATVEFPDQITFSVHVASGAGLDRVVLEYGVDQLTCGSVTARAFPDFEPGDSADVAWTWQMRQSGSQPPGATIWYRWRVIDKSGAQRASEERRVTWLDEKHAWQSVQRGLLTLHWYVGDEAFANDLLDAATSSLDRLSRATGVTPQAPINLYIYGATEDMRASVLYQPGWTGGLAFSDHDIVTIGIAPEQLEWGRRTVAHELTHVLVGHLTFSCLGSVPTWLNEGIAVYGEGGPDAQSAQGLADAVAADRLLAVRALSGGFSEDPARADLSYAQSYSLVAFLVDEFGQEKLNKIFAGLRDGVAIDDALQQVYGFGLDGLEDRWRASVGAPARPSAAPTPTPTPTPVPTYQPIAAAPRSADAQVAAPAAPATAEPVAPAAQPQQPASQTPAASNRRILLLAIGAVALLVAVLAGVTAWLLLTRRKPQR